MRKIKILIVLTGLIFLTSFTQEENNVVGLDIKFRKISEDYLKPGTPNGPYMVMPVEAAEGMKFVKLKMTFTNHGTKDCIFILADSYISTQKDSLYRAIDLTGQKTKIKPGKETKISVLYEFPDKDTPKEFFIEDRRFQIVVEK